MEIGEPDDTGDGASPKALNDDQVIDRISREPVPLKGNEPVRQWIARMIHREHGIAYTDMARNYPIRIDRDGTRKTKKADIAIFRAGCEHTLENLERVVICKPEPKQGRAVTKIKTFEQAHDELAELEELLGTEATPQVRYGLWTNGLDFFFLHKKTARFSAKFEHLTNWPLDPDSSGGGEPGSAMRFRRGEAAMLKTAFRRCHNYIHGNEGMSKDVAFWQFLYLLFAKIHDEQVSLRTGRQAQFYAYAKEPFEPDGQKAIRDRVLDLFKEVKEEYPFFTNQDVITLSPRALAFIVGELGAYNFAGTEIDAKGIAYQELVGTNLRGDRGQYFTPASAVKLMVQILNPQEDEIVFDPACGTGGFLRETLRHQLNRWQEEDGTANCRHTAEQLQHYQGKLADYANDYLFGADFDPSLVRATRLSMLTLTGIEGNVYHMDSLAFPNGHLDGRKLANERIPLGKVKVLMTNPPFGTDIKIEDKETLSWYRGPEGVANSWARDKETGRIIYGEKPPAGMAPEQLFVQRAVQWVEEGGRIGIVLPNGILSNPGPADQAVREWILRNCWVLASIELPVETFIAEANVNILTTLLFLKKKTEKERMAAAGLDQEPDYPVFMAVAEKVGVDRRNNPVYKRHPNGDVILEEDEEDKAERAERALLTGEEDKHPVRMRKAIDDDLPEIAKKYAEFRDKYPEPGLPR